MKVMRCEMCGSSDLVKKGGLFVCQNCGAKYSPEEAKKMMIEGTVKIDDTEEIKALYKLARQYRNDNNSDFAGKYYEQILVKDPYSWEANFYSVYYQSFNCVIGEIATAATRLTNCERTVLRLIKDNVSDQAERGAAITEIAGKLIGISDMLFEAAKNHYDGINYSIQSQYTGEYLSRAQAARDIVYKFGDYIAEFFPDSDYVKEVSTRCWKIGADEDAIIIKSAPINMRASYIKNINVYIDKIKKYDANYKEPQINASGCYIATCVYGSYDCPEVWTLRRYRDNTLAKTPFGRLFIKVYYAVSPKIVTAFGDTAWFKKIWKKRLDRKVKKLKEKGVEDTPYND